jgi:iodotyrosine deiodinase
MTENRFLPLSEYRRYTEQEMKDRTAGLFQEMKRRRTVRDFSEEKIPGKVIEDCIRTAATAPNGANMQPWHFVVISDKKVKSQIRRAAEKVEHEFYNSAATKNWVMDLEHLGTTEEKSFLEKAPILIVIFAQRHGLHDDGTKKKHYYVSESVGLAAGMLITAIHHAGLVSLTYTPGKMRFLNEILNRPGNEKAFMIVVVGYPANDALVPKIDKKPFEDIVSFI